MGWEQVLFRKRTFNLIHDFVMKTLEGEGIHFDAVFVDRTFAADNAPTRKPATGMLDPLSEQRRL